MRDSQRSKVYAAEKIAFDWKYGELDPRFDVGSIEGAQAIAEAVWTSRTILDEYDATRARNVPIIKQAHGKRKNGCYWHERNEIHLARVCGLKWYVLHEVAHALVPESEDRAAHSHEWVACYLDLVRVFMGKRYAEALIEAFKIKRVQYKPKRAYTISAEERERRSARASAMHA